MSEFNFIYDENNIPGSLARLMRYLKDFTGNLDSSNVKYHAWGDSQADNVDATHKLKLKFYVPTGMIRVQKLSITFSLEAFRAYETGAASGGGQTSSNSGGSTVTATVGNTFAVSADGTTKVGDSLVAGSMIIGGSVSGWVLNSSSHVHNFHFTGHGHNVTDEGGTYATTLAQVNVDKNTDAGGVHTHDIYSHNHMISHEHTVTDPVHSHTVSNHTHDITYGIYESTSATGVKVYVDGTLRLDNGGAGYATDQADLDLTQWVLTSGWHTIELSSTQKGRINAAYFMAVYVGADGL